MQRTPLTRQLTRLLRLSGQPERLFQITQPAPHIEKVSTQKRTGALYSDIQGTKQDITCSLSSGL